MRSATAATATSFERRRSCLLVSEAKRPTSTGTTVWFSICKSPMPSSIARHGSWVFAAIIKRLSPQRLDKVYRTHRVAPNLTAAFRSHRQAHPGPPRILGRVHHWTLDCVAQFVRPPVVKTIRHKEHEKTPGRLRPLICDAFQDRTRQPIATAIKMDHGKPTRRASMLERTNHLPRPKDCVGIILHPTNVGRAWAARL